MRQLSTANSLFRDKKYNEAIKYYNAYIKEFCENKEILFSVYYNLSEAYAEIGDYLSARLYYIQSLIFQGKNPDSFIKPFWWKFKSGFIDNETVVVVVPVFESQDTIEETISSLLFQEHKKTIVIAVNDSSSDCSIDLLMRLKESHDKLYVIDNIVNNGPFISLNYGLSCVAPENFGYFMKHDADDVAKFSRIAKQVKAICGIDDKKISTSGYARIDKKTKELVSSKNRGHNMTLYKKEVFDVLGYYDEVRFGADSEYLERCLKKFGKSSEVHIDETLTLAYLDHEKNLVSQNPLGSPARVEYQKFFRFLHSKMKDLDSWGYNNSYGSSLGYSWVYDIGYEAVVCGIASLEDRKNALEDTVNSLVDQVDLLIIYQNGYKDQSGFLCHPKISIVSSLDTGVDMGDAGKFYRLSAFRNCYYFSCDDDLVYPVDYVAKMKSFLKQRSDNVVASCHGRLMVDHPSSYYKDKKQVVHFANHVPEPVEVHFGGTGVMAFHTSRVRFDFNFFRSPNMADVWVGLYAREMSIPIIITPHSKGWIRHSDKFDIDTTIFRSSQDKEGVQDKLISGLHFKDSLEFSEKKVSVKRTDRKIAVGIPTFNRHDFLEAALKRLDEEAEGYNVEVVVNDDGSTPEVMITDDFENIDVKVLRSENLGKKLYWKTVNKIFSALQSTGADYYYYMADDLEIVPGFFDESIAVWESINDDKKLSLNLLNDGREKCWTNYDRHLVRFGSYEVYKSQWLDMIIMFDGRLVDQRVEEVPLSRWNNNPNLSSGVGAQMSTRNHNAGFSMYQMKDSLVIHGDHDSKMNFEERKLNPLVTK